MKAKKKTAKYEKLWIKIRDLIRSVTKKSDHYDEKYTNIKIDSNDKSPVNKTIEISVMVIGVTAIFMKITNTI